MQFADLFIKIVKSKQVGIFLIPNSENYFLPLSFDCKFYDH